MKGIEINEESLISLGCENNQGVWVLRSCGYLFTFTRSVTGVWCFHSPGCDYSHCVSHLDECMGFVAGDLFELGRTEMKRQIRELLDIKESDS